MSRKESFSDRLTPRQVQHVLDALELPWRAHYNEGNDGWVNLPWDSHYYDFEADLSINILHGGFIDQYWENTPYDYALPPKGDMVKLVKWLKYFEEEAEAIQWIKHTLGMGTVPPPELTGGFEFAKDWLKDKDHNYTRIPNEILFSNSLTASEKIVWGAIFERCNGEDIYSTAGMRRISKRLNLAIGTVQKAINKLEELNLLIVKYRGKNVAPQKFPLIADKKAINKAKSTVSNSEQQKGEAHSLKSTVSNSEQGCSSIDTATVSNSEHNNSHKQEPLKQEPNSNKSKIEKPRSLTSVFDDSLKAEKRGTVEQPSIVQALFKERYGAAPDFLKRYTALFRATVKTALYQYDLRLYELSLN